MHYLYLPIVRTMPPDDVPRGHWFPNEIPSWHRSPNDDVVVLVVDDEGRIPLLPIRDKGQNDRRG